MGFLKDLSRQPWFQRAVGITAAEYLRLVKNTGRFRVDPPDIYETITSDLPIIAAMWHGQHLMIPFINRPEYRTKVLISRHRDGEINAIASDWLNVKPIRGSGSHSGDFHRKGGVSGFRAMLTALEEGWNVATTADVPKVSRVAGLGIVKLAQMSGRPIYPVAVTTTHRIQLKNWDKTTINLPFGRCMAVAGTSIRVARDADDAALETARRAVEDGLNATIMRAEQLADGTIKRG